MKKKLKNKAIAASVNVAMITSAMIAPANLVSADEMEINNSIKINLINNKTGLNIDPTDSMNIEIYSDQSKNYIIDGNVVKNNGVLEFVSKSNMPINKSYLFEITSNEYEDFEGEVVFNNGQYELKLNPRSIIKNSKEELFNEKQKAISELQKLGITSTLDLNKIRSARNVSEVDRVKAEVANLYTPVKDDGNIITLSSVDVYNIMNLIDSLDMSRQEESIDKNLKDAKEYLRTSGNKLNNEVRNFIAKAFNDIDKDKILKKQINKIDDINNVVMLLDTNGLTITKRSKPAKITLNFYENEVNGKKLHFKSSEVEFYTKDGERLNLNYGPVLRKIKSFADLDIEDSIVVKIKKDGYFDYSKEISLSKDEKEENLIIKRIPDLNISTENINAVYGDDNIVLASKVEAPADYDGEIKYSIQNGADVVNLNGDVLTINKPGKAIIRYVATKTKIYNETSGTFEVNVAKKDLGTIDANQIDWSTKEKTYDGDKKLNIDAKIKKDVGLVGNDEIKFNATLELENSSVGKKQSVIKKTDIDNVKNEYYNFTISNIGPKIDINPLKVNLKLNPINIKYGSEEWNQIKNNEFPKNINFNNVYSLDDQISESLKKEFNKLDLSKNILFDFSQNKYNVGLYENFYNVRILNEFVGNFDINFDNIYGDIKVDANSYKDDEILNNISLDKENSVNVVKNNNHIYVAPGSVISYKIKDNSLYDKLNIRSTNLDQDDFNINKIVIPANKKNGYISAEVYLSRNDSEDTKTNIVSIPEKEIEIDSKAPDVSFEDGLLTYGLFNKKEKVKFNNNNELVKFTKKHSKEGYIIKTSVNDEQSGVKDKKYSLVKVKSDKEASDILKNIYINESNMAWKDLPKNGEVKVDGSNDGYYILLIKVSDNLGNEAIHASNGIAIDITSPTVVIKGIENKIHTENVAYSIDITDSVRDKVYTGIKNIIINVYDGDKLLESKNKNTNSFKLNQKDLFNGKYNGEIDSFDEFRELSHITNVEGIIDADSNNITVEVIAEDQVGNKIAEKTLKSIIIDKNKAKINANFDNNDFKNEKYFNKDRILNLEINKRNYNEDNLQFNISANGKKGQYSIDDIRNGLVEGVEIISDRQDSEKGVSQQLLTNKRTNTYKILFGSKNKKSSIEYDLEILYKDNNENIKADFSKQDKNVNHFIIDEVPPIIDVEYLNENNGKELVGVDKKNPFYTQGVIKPRLIVKEKNFDKKDVGLKVESYDSKGNSENKYALKNINKVNNDNWINKGDDVNIFDLSGFDKDSNYSLSMEYEDLAGNKAENYNPHYFTIDKINPTASMKVYNNGNVVDYEKIVNKAESRGAIKNFVFNIFGQNDIYFKTRYTDSTSGIKSVGYYIENINENKGETYTSVEDLRSLKWIPKNEFEDIIVKADKAGVLYQRIEDKAGNITYISSNGAFIRDSKNPGKPIIDIKNVTNKNIFNKDITLNIKATDPDNGGKNVFSGIKSVRYEIRDKNTNKITQSDIFINNKSRIKTFENEIRVDSLKSNSNALELLVVAEDYSGNKESSKKEFSIDSTDPIIKAKLDTSDEKHGKYYNKRRNVSVEIKERNFLEEATILTLNINGKTKVFTFKDIKNGIAEKYGIYLASIKDSQLNKLQKTDDRIITYNLLFGVGSNIDYEYSNIEFKTTDEAENKSKINRSIKDFVVDNIKPTINVSYYNGKDVSSLVTTNKNVPLYSQTNISPTITIKDKRFDKKNIISHLEQFNLKVKNLNNYTHINSMKSDKWKVSGDFYTYTMPAFNEDGIYGLALEYEDLAGNKAEIYDTRYFAIDKTPPTGGINLYEDGNKYFYNNLTDGASFAHKSKSGISIDKTATDDVSGIASISYYIYKPETHAQGEFKVLSIDELRKVNWEDWDSLININTDDQFVVYQRIIDRAGNIRYINTQGASIVDKTAPFNPEITITTPENNKGIYNHNVPISISVKDKIVNNSYSGLKKATIEIYNNGVKTQSQEHDISNIKYRKSEFTSNITLDANKNNSNNVVVRVIIEDNAGNIANTEKTISVDITPPKIEVIYDVEASANKKYFNKGRVATIRVYERNFDPNLFNLNIKGGRVNVGNWIVGSKAGLSDDNVNTLRIEFLEDGEYDFTFDLSDKAGNKVKYDRVDNFIVDKTKPVISLSFDKSLVNEKYINSKRVGTITIKEKNFNAREFESKLFARLEGSVISPPTISGWTSNGDIHTATLVFSNDGDYSGSLNYVDLAGNKADEVKIEDFTIDTKAPKIIFEKVKDGYSYKDEVKPEIVLEDINYNKDTTEIKLVGKKHKEIKINGAYVSEGKNKGRIVLNNFPIKKEIDDIYTLIVSNIDKAGNKTEEKIRFSINRFGSNYYFSKNTEKYLKSFYNNKQSDIEIFEINPDELTNQNVNVTRNGSKIKLNSDDFIVKKISNNNWNEYKYVINKKVFKKEGVYEITIDSKDKAGNLQSNKIKEKPIRFVVDKTKPSGVITGVEDNTVYNDLSRLITIKAEDDQRLKSIDLYVDGELIKTFNEKDINENKNDLTYNLKEKAAWQKIKIIMKDAAGNISETEDVRVLITSNTFTRLINNKKVVYGSIGSLIAFFLLLFALIKRKNDESEKEKI